MASAYLKSTDGEIALFTEVPDCLELSIDKTGTIYTPNLEEINDVFKDDFKKMCRMLAQAALMEMQTARILH